MKNFDASQIKTLFKSFEALSCNRSTEDDKLSIYLTRDSILENFKRVFHVYNESTALRFYNVLSDGINMKRIYLPKYLLTVLPLFSTNLIERNYFVFRILDGDNDGLLQSKDISDIMTNLLMCPIHDDIKSCSCPLFNEIHMLYEIYV